MTTLGTIIDALFDLSGWEEQEAQASINSHLTSQQRAEPAQLHLSITEHCTSPGILRAIVKQQDHELFTLQRWLPAHVLTYPEIEQFVERWRSAGHKVTVSMGWITHVIAGRLSPGARAALEACRCSIQQMGTQPELYLVTFKHADYYRAWDGGEYEDLELRDDQTLVLRSEGLEFLYDKSGLDVCLHSLRLLDEPAEVLDACAQNGEPASLARYRAQIAFAKASISEDFDVPCRSMRATDVKTHNSRCWSVALEWPEPVEELGTSCLCLVSRERGGKLVRANIGYEH